MGGEAMNYLDKLRTWLKHDVYGDEDDPSYELVDVLTPRRFFLNGDLRQTARPALLLKTLDGQSELVVPLQAGIWPVVYHTKRTCRRCILAGIESL